MIRTTASFFSGLALAFCLATSNASASHLDPKIKQIRGDLYSIANRCKNETETEDERKKCLEEAGYDKLLKELKELEELASASNVKHDDPETEKRLKKLADQAKKKAKGK